MNQSSLNRLEDVKREWSRALLDQMRAEVAWRQCRVVIYCAAEASGMPARKMLSEQPIRAELLRLRKRQMLVSRAEVRALTRLMLAHTKKQLEAVK